jgi:predicted restriction endonuclease
MSNGISNLITLCPNHHRMADLGIIDLEDYRDFLWSPDSWTA